MTRTLKLVVVATLMVSLAVPAAGLAEAQKAAAQERSTNGAMWLSIAHPGLGEYYLNGWGNFGSNCPQRKFWLGMIPLYGWPGYLQVLSAIDAKNGRTGDNITPVTE